MEPELEEVLGVPNCFPGVLITGSSCLLDSDMVDPRDDTYNFNSSRGCQDDHVRACSNLLKCFFFPLIFNPHQTFNPLIRPHLLADRDEPNCPKDWVSFLSFLR